MRRTRAWLREEDGEMVVEATIVMVVTVMVVFLLLNISVFVMQRGNLVVQANRAAVRLAGEYQNKMSEYDYDGSNPMLKAVREISSEETAEKIEKQIAGSELFHPSSVPDESMEFVKCDVVGVNKEMGVATEHQKRVVVLATRYYQMLAINPCAYFGLDTMYLAKAEGKADCYDLFEEMSRHE